MKEAILLTEHPIEPKICADIFKKSISDVCGNDQVVSFGKAQKSLYVWFPSLVRTEENEKFIYDEIPNLPDSHIFGTHVEYHRDQELKRAAELLSEIYPELYIIDDEEHVFSAAEYFANKSV